MLKKQMADSRLDLDAPLLSVRRFASEPDTAHAPPAPGDPNPTRSALPFYKSDLKSGPVTNPGVVPFVWEQSPGQPKPSAAVSVRTLRKSTEVEELQPLPSQQQEDDDEFADALETMSRTESYFLNCSEPTEASRSFAAADRDFVMDRFLPAAKAMAREREILDRPNTRVPLSYRYGPYYVRDGNADEDDEGDDCYESNGHFMGKACGLIPNFCFKTSFCLLNPVPGMKVSNRRMAPKRICSRQVKGYVGQAEEEYSWEAVYKHRLTQTDSSKGEDRSKITTESDRLMYGSDYRTADGALPYHRSNCVGVSSCRNEPSQLPFLEGKGFLGVPKRGSKNYKSDSLAAFVEREREEDYWGVVPIRGSIQGSCSMSPTFDRTLHVDSEQMLGTPHSKSSSLDTSSENKVTIQSAGKDSEMGVESRRMEESLVLETCHRDVLQPKLSEPELKISLERSVGGVTDENNGIEQHDGLLPLIEEGQVKNGADLLRSLLPPPLPNSPSDSWLSHALPSVSSKNTSAQSFLGIQMHPKKQVANVSPADVKLKASAKPPRLQCGLTRFADMLEKPLSP